MTYRGDVRLGSTVRFKFTTRRFSTGAPHTLAGTPAIAAYVNGSTTEITAGITLTVDFDSRTGLNHVEAVLSSGNGFAAGDEVGFVITAGTVDSVSVVGEVVAAYSIEARSALMPTTSGRTLDVSATGEAGVDWANVGSPTTAVNLSGTTVKTATDVETDTADIQSRLPAALVSGRMDSSVGAMASGVLTAAAIAADAITDAKVAADVTIASVTGSVGSVTGNVGGNVTGSVGSVTGNVGGNVVGSVGSVAGSVSGSVASVVGNVGGNVTGSVGSIAAGGIVATSIAADALTASKFASDVGAEIAAAVRTELATELARVDAAVSTRASQASVDTVGANVDAILVDTGTDIPATIATAQGTLDKLDDTLEDDGGVFRFTTNALEQAPTGGGGGTADWTADVRTAIRTILGVPASGTTPAAPTAGALKTIDDEVGALQTSVDALPTAAENATAVRTELGTELGRIDVAVSTREASGAAATAAAPLATSAALATVAGYVDTEIGTLQTTATAIKAKTDNLPAAPAATGDIPSAATVAGAVRTELAVELARVDVASSTLATAAALTAVDGKVDTVDANLDAVKGKTDGLTFTTAGVVDANVRRVNDVTIDGTGAVGDEWGPA
jgi:hypothetical protein